MVMKLRAQGVTRINIAERLGISVGAVHHHIRYVMYGPAGGPPTMSREEAEALWAKHRSVREISNATGIGLKHVGIILRGHGIKFKNHSVKSYRRLKPTFNSWGGALENSRPVSVWEVKNGLCRWPIFDLPGEPKLFCGATAEGVYCPKHHEMSVYEKELKPVKMPSWSSQQRMSMHSGHIYESATEQLADSLAQLGHPTEPEEP
jgi:hypothetical protein